jgi:prepilin-type processing-associated H-X9-DG protein
MIASFVCPTDAFPAPIRPNDSGTTGQQPYSMQFARESNYLVNAANYTEYNCPGWPGGTSQSFPNPIYRGVFYSDISTGLNDIKDGTSNTFLVGESKQPPGHYSNYYGPYWGSGTHTSTHGRILPPSNSSAPACAPNGWSVYFYPTLATYAGGIYAKLPYAWVFSSYHAGGVNMGMCDGSVRWIKDTINLYSWWGLASIANNEVISADSF